MKGSCWKVPASAFRLALALAFVWGASPALARIDFDGIELRQLSGDWHLSAQSRLALSEDALDLLGHGIPLVVRTRLRVRRQRAWLWDETLYVREVRRRVQYEPLSERYVVVDTGKFTRSSFRKLENAIAHLGRFEDYLILQGGALPLPGRYYATLHAKVEINALPAAMRPIAWLSPAWDLESAEYRWELRP